MAARGQPFFVRAPGARVVENGYFMYKVKRLHE